MEAIVERSGNVESYGAMVQTDWPINGWNTQHDQNLWSRTIRTCILSLNEHGNTKKKALSAKNHGHHDSFKKNASLFLGDSVAAKTGGSRIPMDFCRSIFAFFRSTWQYSSATDVGAVTQKWSPAGRSRKFTVCFFGRQMVHLGSHENGEFFDRLFDPKFQKVISMVVPNGVIGRCSSLQNTF